MGCLSNRRKQTENLADQKWDYINLMDFKAKGCGTILAYIYLWLMLLVSVAVYAVDSFTAVNLLAFNRWSSGIDPAIGIEYSKWIFSVCIILSFLNLGYEGIRAFRVIRRGNVAECYLDSLAARWESIRIFGSGQGFRRFLVFAELTKSKKGAEYVALFTYFSFQSWIRVIICSGPRQVVNAFTIKAVYDAQLAISSKTVEGSITGFFDKIKSLAEHDYRQALTLSGMCFTLVVWVFSALFLLAAMLFWLLFLWHWIPSSDGGLPGYCSRKVTKTLMKIVTTKVNKAIAKQEATRLRSELKAAQTAQLAQKKNEKPAFERAPTLPNVGNDKLSGMPTLGRSETMATLPPYTSRPGTPGGMELSNMEKRRPVPSRSGTMASNYSSRAPLVSSASEMGYGESSPPRMPRVEHGNYPQRQDTMASSYSNGPQRHDTMTSSYNNGPQRHDTMTSSYSNGPQQPLRPMLSNASGNRFTETPAPMHAEPMAYPPPPRAPSARPMDNYAQSNDSLGPISTPAPSYRPYDPYGPDDRASPAPTVGSNWGGPQRPMNPPMGPPLRSATAPIPPRAPQYPQRNMTAHGYCLSPVGERSERDSMTSSVISSSFTLPGGVPPHMVGSPPPRNGAASVAPSSVVLGLAAHENMAGSIPSRAGAASAAPSSVVLTPAAYDNMSGSPAPRGGPSPAPGGQSQGYDAYRYDVESQRGGHNNWNY